MKKLTFLKLCLSTAFVVYLVVAIDLFPFEMHFKGFKYKEIADKLEIPIGTVKSRIYIARKKLIDLLPDYSFSIS